jgi:hypothetical protein
MSEFNQRKSLADRLRDRYDSYGTLSEQTHEAYNSWADAMHERSGKMLVPIDYAPDRYIGQSIYEPVIEAKDPHPEVPKELYYDSIKGQLVNVIGEDSYDRLMEQLRNQPASTEDPRTLLGRLATNRQQGKNTMVVSSHFSFMELAYFNHLRFIGKQDRPNIDKNAVVLSKLLSRISYGGIPVSEAARPTSSILFSSPISESTKDYKIPTAATKIMNALFVDALRTCVDKGGMELDVALTGKQIISHPEGAVGKDIDHYEIPEVAKNSAELIRLFDDIVPVTVMWSPVTGKWEMVIDDVIDVQESLKTNKPIEIVQPMYKKMAGHIETFTGKEVDYPGSPRKIGRQAIEQGFQ